MCTALVLLINNDLPGWCLDSNRARAGTWRRCGCTRPGANLVSGIYTRWYRLAASFWWANVRALRAHTQEYTTPYSMNILSLPADILSIIFNLISLPDVINLSQVCVYFFRHKLNIIYISPNRSIQHFISPLSPTSNYGCIYWKEMCHQLIYPSRQTLSPSNRHLLQTSIHG